MGRASPSPPRALSPATHHHDYQQQHNQQQQQHPSRPTSFFGKLTGTSLHPAAAASSSSFSVAADIYSFSTGGRKIDFNTSLNTTYRHANDDDDAPDEQRQRQRPHRAHASDTDAAPPLGALSSRCTAPPSFLQGTEEPQPSTLSSLTRIASHRIQVRGAAQATAATGRRARQRRRQRRHWRRRRRRQRRRRWWWWQPRPRAAAAPAAAPGAGADTEGSGDGAGARFQRAPLALTRLRLYMVPAT